MSESFFQRHSKTFLPDGGAGVENAQAEAGIGYVTELRQLAGRERYVVFLTFDLAFPTYSLFFFLIKRKQFTSSTFQ
tara:strand:- start:178 stop:408 length:231 start_codon:yes stop_codon:yes gene_type:complete